MFKKNRPAAPASPLTRDAVTLDYQAAVRNGDKPSARKIKTAAKKHDAAFPGEPSLKAELRAAKPRKR